MSIVGYIMKLQQLNHGVFVISLPSQIIRAKEWKKGDEIKAVINDRGDIVLRK